MDAWYDFTLYITLKRGPGHSGDRDSAGTKELLADEYSESKNSLPVTADEDVLLGVLYWN